MDGLFDSVLAYLREHWIELLVAAGSALIGWFLGKRRARHEWRRKEFYDRLNVSMTTIQNGRLLIRTLIEKRCEEVFLNRVASESVIAAARQTTEAAPILPLSEGDYWYYLNAVLNEVAEKFAAGTMRRDIRGEAACTTYLLCLTSEAAGAVRTRKVRAMLVKKALLEHLPEQMPSFESPNHATRWHTLGQLAAAWKTTPQKFIEVEICV
jgi:hypothetical protein